MGTGVGCVVGGGAMMTTKSNIAHLAIGSNYVIALRSDGTFVVWGAASSVTDRWYPEWNEIKIVQVDVAEDYFIFLGSEGELIAQGHWKCERYYHSSYQMWDMPLDFQLHNVRSIAASDDYALFLLSNGKIVLRGHSIYYDNDSNEFENVVDVDRVITGKEFAVAVTRGGRVVALDVNGYQRFLLPENLPLVSHVVLYGHYSADALALTVDGRLIEWSIGQDEGDTERKIYETVIHEHLHDVVQIALTRYHSMAVTADGRVILWEKGRYLGEPRYPGSEYSKELEKKDYMLREKVKHLQGIEGVYTDPATDRLVFAVTNDSRVIGLNLDEHHTMFDYQMIPPQGLPNIVQIVAWHNHILAVTEDRHVVAWGSANQHDSYKLPDGLTDIVQVAAGYDTRMALRANGQLIVWGANPYGNPWFVGYKYVEPGNFFPWLENVVHVVAGNGTYWAALHSNGTISLFGRDKRNNYWCSQVNAASSHTDVVQIALNTELALVVLRDGRVLIEKVYSKSEKDVLRAELPAVLNGVKQVSLSEQHVLVITFDGNVYAWGNNTNGQCNVPTELHDVVQVVAGDTYSLAVTRAGNVLAWGEKWNKDVVRCFPKTSNVQHVVVGDEHALAITKDHRVIAWGNNDNGQCDVPVWLRDVVHVVAGHQCSLALLRSGSIVFWGGNSVADTARLIQIGTSPRLQYIHPFAAYAGGEAELYSTPSGLLKKYHTSGLLKKYHTSEKTPALTKLQHIIAHPVTLTHADRPLIIWPQKLAYHPFTGELAGYVMPFVAATQLIDVLDRTKRITRWPDLATDPRREWQFVLTVARWSAAVLAHIHAHGYVVGDLSPRNILVYEEGTVAFVDCDSYQVGDGSVYGCSVSTAGYRAPEVRQRAHGRLQYSVHSDAFALAVAIFRLLCGNLHPYQGITLPSATLTPAQHRATKQQYPHLQPIPDGVDATTYCYERGIWPYDATQQLCVPPVEIQAYYLQLPVEVRGLFGRAFTGAPAQRPTPLEWVQVLDAWLGEVR
jgi:alpha-tubulin suppressor-like RCC1 family protein